MAENDGVGQLGLVAEVLGPDHDAPAGRHVETERAVARVGPDLLDAQRTQLLQGSVNHQSSVPAALHVEVNGHVAQLVRTQLGTNRGERREPRGTRYHARPQEATEVTRGRLGVTWVIDGTLG